MKTKRKIKGTRNPLFLHINNLINRREFFSVVLLFCSYHHVMDEKLLKRLLFRFFSRYLEFLNTIHCADDFDERENNFYDVLSHIKHTCVKVPSMYHCLEYLFERYCDSCDLKGGVL